MFYTDLNRNGFSVFSLNKILALGSGYIYMGPPWWLSGKESTCNAGDMGLILWLRSFLGEENGNHSSVLS